MITAIVLAAGQSRRMGAPKINLPWGETTVLGQVLGTLLQAGLEEIILVTGAHPVEGLEGFVERGVKAVFNPHHAAGEMLSSFQAGLRAAPKESEAALLALGDQPQMQADVVRAVVEVYRLNRPKLLIPSFQMHRGHPGVVGRSLWEEILAMEPPATLREFLNAHAREIQYLPVVTETVLQDLDTPEDYERYIPK
jgi:molybdenum cofactor cytidylyltransferase